MINVRTLSEKLSLRFAAFRFLPKRADYYEYLADIIHDTKGRKTLRDILAEDAARHGPKTVRGKLTAHWLSRFSQGGSLLYAFSGTLPSQDVAVIDMLQENGGENALVGGLRDLSENVNLVSRSRTVMLSSMAMSLISIAILGVSILMVPLVTVPELFAKFKMLTPEEYPPVARSLLAFSDAIESYWHVAIIGLGVLGGLVFKSVTSTTGRVRKFLDKWGIAWGLYRDFESIRFLTTLAASIRRHGNKTPLLQDAIDMQRPAASTWKLHHLEQMKQTLRKGQVGPDTFKTGIFEQEMEWYLSDVIDSRGLSEGLQAARRRLEGRVAKRIKFRSTVISWILLLGSIFISAAITFWHFDALNALMAAVKSRLS